MHIPERYTETHTGVYEQDHVGATVSQGLKEHYADGAERILQNDQRHYRKLTELLNKRIDAAGISRTSCVAIGGGHPKLEVTAGFERIVVLDALANEYGEKHELFEKYYGAANVEYMQAVSDFQNIKINGTVTLVHFLEHLTADAGTELIEQVATNPLIIYGPNIQSARNEDWFHFRPADHNTFWTAEALEAQLRDVGYDRVDVTPYSDDYLIIATRERKDV